MRHLISVEDWNDFSAEADVADDAALLRKARRVITDIIGDEFAAQPSGKITLTAREPYL